ncbi:MAG: transcriptional regulator [Nitrososphaerales archaeon]
MRPELKKEKIKDVGDGDKAVWYEHNRRIYVKKESLIDAVLLSILAKLYRSRGIRYVELKNKLNVSDSTLKNRLDRLRRRNLITIQAKRSESGRNYIAYTLTDMGKKIVEHVKVSDVLERFDELTFA